MNIALFGGSFDPPHMGHEYILQEAVCSLNLGLVYIVPAYRSPFKSTSFALPKHRLAMVQIMANFLSENCNCCQIQVLRNEIDNYQTSYSYETIKHIRLIHSTEQIFMILGDDHVADLPQWKNWDYIRKQVNIVVFTRNNSSAHADKNSSQPFIYMSNMPRNISSREIRRSIAQNNIAVETLNKEVYEYIVKHALYT